MGDQQKKKNVKLNIQGTNKSMKKSLLLIVYLSRLFVRHLLLVHRGTLLVHCGTLWCRNSKLWDQQMTHATVMSVLILLSCLVSSEIRYKKSMNGEMKNEWNKAKRCLYMHSVGQCFPNCGLRQIQQGVVKSLVNFKKMRAWLLCAGIDENEVQLAA